jgi:prefoldin subunit 5
LTPHDGGALRPPSTAARGRQRRKSKSQSKEQPPMSYAIIRIEKYTAGKVHGIQIHDRREKDKSHTNRDIDFTRSHLNYSLDEREGTFAQAVKERIAELKMTKAVRKDAIVMCQALVTSDRDFFDGLSDDQQRQYFQQAYDFIANKYGKENIISATVHMDEKTPHLHVNFVPIMTPPPPPEKRADDADPDRLEEIRATKDSKPKLCAKDLFKRDDLKALQDQFHAQVGEPWGLERGTPREENSEKRHKHLKVSEYKSMMKEVSDLTAISERAARHLADIKADIVDSKDELAETNEHIEIQQGALDDLTATVNELARKAQLLDEEMRVADETRSRARQDIEKLKADKSALEDEISHLGRVQSELSGSYDEVRALWLKLAELEKQKSPEFQEQFAKRLEYVALQRFSRYVEKNYPDLFKEYEELAKRPAKSHDKDDKDDR